MNATTFHKTALLFIHHCYSSTTLGKTITSLFAKVLDTSLHAKDAKLIGRKYDKEDGCSTFETNISMIFVSCLCIITNLSLNKSKKNP